MQEPVQQLQPVIAVQPQPQGYTNAAFPEGHTNAAFPQGQPVTTTTNTVVLINQPVVAPVQGPRQWSTGLLGCFEDCGSCCLGYLCPMFLMTDISSRLGESCCFPYCCPGALLGLRIKVRVEQNIEGSLCNDYCIVCCCPLCVMCQLSRELKHVGR